MLEVVSEGSSPGDMSGREYFGTEDGTDEGTSGDMSGGEVWSCVCIPIEYVDGNLDGFLLGYVLGTGYRTEVGTYGVISGGEV